MRCAYSRTNSKTFVFFVVEGTCRGTGVWADGRKGENMGTSFWVKGFWALGSVLGDTLNALARWPADLPGQDVHGRAGG